MRALLMSTSTSTTPHAPPASRPDGPPLEQWGLVPAPPRSRQLRGPGPVALALAISALAAVAYLIASPPAADLAAATYRAALFAREGFALWNNGWYGGHALLGYSVLAPALSAMLGARVLLALSSVVAAGLFAAIAQDAFEPPAALAAAALFALSLAGELLSGRVPYDLGVAVALVALLALQRGHTALALLAAPVASLASPIAGAFLALAGIALALCERRPRGVWLVACALVPIAILAIAFPEGGYEPFAAGAFWPELAGVLVVAAVLPGRWRVLRAGALLYAVALVLAFTVHTPVGGNAARLGALLAAPVVAAALWGRRPLLLALLAPALLYWQLATPASDLAKVAGDRSLNPSYYAPLRGEIERLSAGTPVRVEIPMTGAHTESELITDASGATARGLTLARGWERQLDTRYAPVFYGAQLGARAYRSWLLDNGVAFVAFPDVRLDESAQQEGRLIRHGLPYLHETWRSAHWRLFAVDGASALATPPARLVALASQSFALAAPSAGTYEVRVRFNPYWALTSGHGCVREAPGGWTTLQARSAGVLRVGIDFSLARVFEQSARCR